MVQNLDKDGGRYRATGWLGVITAGKLWTDFRDVEDDGAKIAQQCDALLLEIANKLNVGRWRVLEISSSMKYRITEFLLQVTGRIFIQL